MTEIDSILKDAQSVAVSGHVRPDGDCVGSTPVSYTHLDVYKRQGKDCGGRHNSR